MCVIPNFHNPDEEILHIAPGENKQPQSFFTFPFLFPTGKFGYKVTRPIHLTATKYFNQRLLNFSQRFSSNADYIFFAHYVMQQANLFNWAQLLLGNYRIISKKQLDRLFVKTKDINSWML